MTATTARPAATRRGDDARAALLAAAHDLLSTGGAGALTVRRIAAAAGMGTMSVYCWFGGKDGVLDELFIDGFRRLAAKMGDAPSTADPIADRRTFGAVYRELARESGTGHSVMFDRLGPDFDPSGDAKATALGALGQVAPLAERAMDAGRLRPGDAFTVAAVLWACEHGVSSLEEQTPADGGPFDWDTIAPLAVEALLAGLAAPS